MRASVAPVHRDDAGAAEAEVVLQRDLRAATWRLSAVPRSCQTSSVHCARPVAPSGWPLESSPPDGLVTTLPPYVLSPSQMNFSASPSLQSPSPS